MHWEPRIYVRNMLVLLSIGLLISQAVASKDSDRYSQRQAFLISDENWEEVLQLVPLAVWTSTQGSEDREWCNMIDEKVCAYPALVYHQEYSGMNLNLQRISRKNIFMHGYESVGLTVMEDSLFFHPDRIKNGEVTRVEIKLLNNGTKSVNPKNIEIWNWPLKDYLKPTDKDVLESGKIKIDVDSDIMPGEIRNLVIEFRLNLTERPGFDADSTIQFLKEFRPDRLIIAGEIPAELRVRLKDVLE